MVQYLGLRTATSSVKNLTMALYLCLIYVVDPPISELVMERYGASSYPEFRLLENTFVLVMQWLMWLLDCTRKEKVSFVLMAMLVYRLLT